jgi:HPt (histidine-containing phosphotransfer) domain-containing protein
MLTRPRLARAPVSQGPHPTQGAVGAESRPGLVLDAAALAGLRALDPTGQKRLMERLFAAFQSSTGRLIPQLLESQRNADPKGLRHVAHTLKSSAANVGGMKLSGICAELETRIRLGQTSDLQPLVDALVEEVQSLLLALQQLSEASR